MATGHNKRKRPIQTRRKNSLRRLLDMLRSDFFWQRLAVCFVAALMMWLMTRGWEPPFSYRVGDYPDRDLYARVDFEYPDLRATEERRQRERFNVLCYYENRPKPLEELPDSLAASLFSITGADDFESLDPTIIDEFIIEAGDEGVVTEELRRAKFDAMREALIEDTDGSKVRRAIEIAMLGHIRKGLFKNLEHQQKDGSTRQILVYENGNEESNKIVDVSDVRFQEIAEQLRETLTSELTKEFSTQTDAAFLADHVFFWIERNVPVTLKYNPEMTRLERDRVAAAVPIEMKRYQVGQRLERRKLEDANSRGIDGGQPLAEEDLNLLRAEHEAFLSQRSWTSV